MNVVEAFTRMQQCRDLASFYRRWAATEGVGLPRAAALPSLREGSVASIEGRIRAIAKAMERGDLEFQEHREGFTAVEVAFINVGFVTGNLDVSLNSLAEMYESDYRTVLKAKRKATYPLMMAFCACWVPTFPLAFFVDPIAWVVVGTLLTVAVFMLGGVAIWRYFVWLRATPRWSQIRFFWSLATALEAGLHIDQALALSAKATAPSKLSDCLMYAVPRGRPISEILRTSGVFDAAALTMIETGEVSGRLPDTLRQAASYLESGTM